MASKSNSPFNICTLAALSGWMVQNTVIPMLRTACKQASSLPESEFDIRLITGRETSTDDTAVWFSRKDPTSSLVKSFPEDNAIEGVTWVTKNDQSAIQTFGLEIKSTTRVAHPSGSHRSRTQSKYAPVILLQLYPDYVFLIPYHDAVRETLKVVNLARYNFHGNWISGLPHLAPYIVHRSHLAAQLLALSRAASREPGYEYQNSYTGVSHGNWKPIVYNGAPQLVLQPQLDSKAANAHRAHRYSEDSIDYLTKKLSHSALELRRNPTEPLICDRILVDRQTNRHYFVEMKIRTRHDHLRKSVRAFTEGLISKRCHFIFFITSSKEDPTPHILHVYRTPDRLTYPPSIQIDMKLDEDASLKLESFIRSHGKKAEEIVNMSFGIDDKLQNNKDLRKVCRSLDMAESYVHDPEETVDDPEETIDDPEETVDDPEDTVDDPEETFAVSDFNDFNDAFCKPFNQMCRRVGSLFCWPLNPRHPVADALIFEHEWDQEDKELFDSVGSHPFPLSQKCKEQKCIPIIFGRSKCQPHRIPAYGNDMGKLLSEQRATGLPVCPKVSSILVAFSVHEKREGQIIPDLRLAAMPRSVDAPCQRCDAKEVRYSRCDGRKDRIGRQSFRTFYQEDCKMSFDVFGYFVDLFEKEKDAQQYYMLPQLLQIQFNHGWGGYPQRKWTRRLIPCTHCWDTHQSCDKAAVCQVCQEDKDKPNCLRERCVYYHEFSGVNCPFYSDCTRAHHDDGYPYEKTHAPQGRSPFGASEQHKKKARSQKTQAVKGKGSRVMDGDDKEHEPENSSDAKGPKIPILHVSKTAQTLIDRLGSSIIYMVESDPSAEKPVRMKAKSSTLVQVHHMTPENAMDPPIGWTPTTLDGFAWACLLPHKRDICAGMVPYISSERKTCLCGNRRSSAGKVKSMDFILPPHTVVLQIDEKFHVDCYGTVRVRDDGRPVRVGIQRVSNNQFLGFLPDFLDENDQPLPHFISDMKSKKARLSGKADTSTSPSAPIPTNRKEEKAMEEDEEVDVETTGL